MELFKNNLRQNKTLSQYSKDVYTKWIPCTIVGGNGLTCEGDWDNPVEESGRWAIFSRGLNTHNEILQYIVETENHHYRDITEYDVAKLYRLDKYRKAKELGYMNSENYNQVKEIEEFNRILKAQERQKQSELNKEKAKDMWGYVTGRPYITAGMEFAK